MRSPQQPGARRQVAAQAHPRDREGDFRRLHERDPGGAARAVHGVSRQAITEAVRRYKAVRLEAAC
jgi:hypothetical protein